MGLYTALCNMHPLNRKYYLMNNTFKFGEVEDCIEDMGLNKKDFECVADMLEYIRRWSAGCYDIK